MEAAERRTDRGVEMNACRGSLAPASASAPAEPLRGAERRHREDPDRDPGRRLISGLLGLNLVLLGAALVAGRALNPEGLRQQEPQVFLLLLLGSSLLWLLWYLLWARRRPGGAGPHTDHHAAGAAVLWVLLLFAAFSLLLYVCRAAYLITMRACKPAAVLLSPFVEAPFLGLQTYFLWAHSKDCVHKYKIITRCGLMLMLAADLLLWLNAVTEDSVHQELEWERAGGLASNESSDSEGSGSACRCGRSRTCASFRKAVEVLFPFHMEFYLMAACMVYVLWKNVGRRTAGGRRGHAHTHAPGGEKLTVRVVYRGGVVYGPALGVLLLLAGLAVFVLYQVWVHQRRRRFAAFAAFYGYQLAVLPVMSLCSLAGALVHRRDRRARDGGRNPTRSLDALLLVAAALGQAALSYFSLVAALAEGARDTLGGLDLSYSVLSLLELLLQNIFIIEGLHRHPSKADKRTDKRRGRHFKKRKESEEEGSTSAPPAGQARKQKTKRAIQEICAFLIFCNVMLWVIPAFGVHPQFENGLGKRFFGFGSWFVLVNLGQPLAVFYRMHSVGALTELLLKA